MAHAPAQANERLLVFGEFFLDLVFYDLPQVPKMGEEVKTRRFATFPGGGVATTAMVAAELGTPTSVITRVGEDARMNPAWQKLVQSGVSVEACSFDKYLPTALTVCASYDSDRMMITQDAINRNLDKLLAMPGAKKQLRRAKHLHVACALWPLSPWKLTIRRLKGRGLALSADLGWNPRLWQSQQWLPLLKHFDFVFPNEQEARAMTDEKSVEKAACKLGRWAPMPVVKLGRDGSLAVRDGRIIRIKSLRVRAVDATGAGDAFNGGFLHAHLSGWPLEDCLRAGNVCGALATTGPGGSCRIPSSRKLKELMRKL
ncbi:MAG TPA: carbohydrate kinase family protein [Candidatus Acidoferrum sp.]|jgi:sugar/nucleoside kinase (ribokinase family)|nr:carbohydrate kinase family protein [Candidatus Acidoferrum sp.]